MEGTATPQLVRGCSVAVSISQELPSLLLGSTGGPVILNHEQMSHGNSGSHKTAKSYGEH